MDTTRICILTLLLCSLNDVTIGQVNWTRYTAEPNKILFGSYLTLTATSASVCCFECSHNGRCKTVNYHKGSGKCQLVTKAAQEFITDSPGWTMYYPEGSCDGLDPWWKHGRSCYVTFPTSKTWKQSHDYCNAMGGSDILQIDDLAEWQYISNYLQHASIDVYPITFTLTTDDTKRCMPEVIRQLFPVNVDQWEPSVCGVTSFEENGNCPYVVRGALGMYPCSNNIVSKYTVCEKSPTY